MRGGVSMHVASRDAACMPTLSRPLGVRISNEHSRVTVILLASHSEAMLADFQANGEIALVVTLPSSHRTIQLKGNDARAEPLAQGDPEIVERTRAAFTRELVAMGWDRSLPETLLAGARADMVAVSFTVRAMFTQTPGPNAGARIS
jgi:hypothetical protein